MKLKAICGLGLCGPLMLSLGCLERKESIRVATDGRVIIELEYRGQSESWQTADTMPAKEGGWEVLRSTEKKGDKEEKVLTARRTFEPGERLPSTYALKDIDAELALAFPTQVWVEQRDGAKYMHFRRTYSPRPWAYVRFHHDQAFDDDVKALAEKPLKELSRDDRVKLFSAFAAFEGRRQAEFLETAVRRALPEWPQDRWLPARQALLDAYEKEIDFEAFVDALEALPEEQRDARLEQEAESVLNRAIAAMKKSLGSGSRVTAEELARFDEAFERVKRQYEITDQLGTHAFKITVSMPGRIVAHNADEVDDDGNLEWEFSGEAFRDRPYELMVTARVSND